MTTTSPVVVRRIRLTVRARSGEPGVVRRHRAVADPRRAVPVAECEVVGLGRGDRIVAEQPGRAQWRCEVVRRFVVAVRHGDLPARGAGARAAQGGHVLVVAMRVTPDLQVVPREDRRLVVRDADDGDVGNAAEVAAGEDAVGQRGVVVARQDHHRDGGIGQQATGAIQHGGWDAVVVKCVAGEKDDVGAGGARGRKHRGEACGAIVVLGGVLFVIDVQIGAVDQEQVHRGRLGGKHGWYRREWGEEGKTDFGVISSDPAIRPLLAPGNRVNGVCFQWMRRNRR